MKNIVTSILILFLLSFFMINNILAAINMKRNTEIKNILNRSCKVIADAISIEDENISHIADGYLLKRRKSVELDLEKLDRMFVDTLKYNAKNRFNIENIKLKVVVYDERFFIQDNRGIWIPRYFRDDKKIINIFDNKYHSIKDDTLKNLPKNYDKEVTIINQLNDIVAGYISDFQNSFTIGIKNSSHLTLENRNFNVLDGVTFFVLYEDDEVSIIQPQIKEKTNFSLAGYTINTWRQMDESN